MGMRKGQKWINKNGKEKVISPDQVDEFLKKGWELGRLKGLATGKIWINKNGIGTRIHPDRVNKFLNDDWELGRLPFSEETKQKMSEWK